MQRYIFMKKDQIINIVFGVALVLGSAAVGVWVGVHDLPLSNSVVWCWLVLAAVLAAALPFARVSAINRELREMAPLVRDDPDEYLRQLEALLGGEEGSMKPVYHLNRGAALCNKGDYAAAKQAILQVNPKKLAGKRAKAICRADLALVHFSLGEDAEGLALLDAHPELLKELEKLEGGERLAAMLRVYERLARGDRAGAERAMEFGRDLWAGDRTKPLETLEKRLGQ